MKEKVEKFNCTEEGEVKEFAGKVIEDDTTSTFKN